jgi:hypothetical protein
VNRTTTGQSSAKIQRNRSPCQMNSFHLLYERYSIISETTFTRHSAKSERRRLGGEILDGDQSVA